MTRFEIGSTYQTRSICDHNCIISVTIASRTRCFVRTTEGKRFKVSGTQYRENCQFETLAPWGNHSMSPTITAENPNPNLKADWEK